MTTLHIEPYPIPAADLGSENPLPMFRGPDNDGTVNVDGDVPPQDRARLGWRTAWRILPHRVQDNYTRTKSPHAFDSLVLENHFLRAVFLPRFGGRLVSLYYKPGNRELLARNPVFQPANLALRNAWFSGGIEWNSGQPGHHYLTCSSVFAAEVEGLDGTPCLRLYEWDRVKGYTWQIDFHLPNNSPLLFAHTRIANPHDDEIAMYWWTNIAVEEREDIRVLVPAETALCNPYWKGLQMVDLPQVGGRDISYSTRIPHAFDFFSRIPPDRRRWIAALDEKGSGFFETSTDRLIGRKLFCWGRSPGGQQWQEFLAEPGFAYIEIQAGLARTQMECIPMPAHTEWEWTEAFGFLQADPAHVHSEDWKVAWMGVAEEIERHIPRHSLERMDAEFTKIAAWPTARVLSRGSGWGALERRRCLAGGTSDKIPQNLTFNCEDIGDEQVPWTSLLEKGFLPCRSPSENPGALMVQSEWQTLLEASLRTTEGGHWLAWWHLGNIRMENRDIEGACQAWEESISRRASGWAYRNLSVVAQRRGDIEAACRWMEKAWEIGPKIAPLAIEYAQILLNKNRAYELLEFIRTLPENLRTHERILLLWAKAALDTGEIDGVERIFEHEYAAIREGEVTLTDLWFNFHLHRLAKAEGIPIDEQLRERVRQEYPPPRRIDFRMAAEARSSK